MGVLAGLADAGETDVALWEYVMNDFFKMCIRDRLWSVWKGFMAKIFLMPF